jgi:hypothetical protein
MTISSTQLAALVNAAKATGEDRVTTQLADGTIIEIHLVPENTEIRDRYPQPQKESPVYEK